ncbi:LOW QUALITY PROTEIN: glycerophosphodiester phosphodiesterase GDPD2 [Gossypium hirsutum]|uniref:LOW QUALITY PROTEIN: glycerophosphodiester phosphodiesterase GDPD2 n=1 Tax=Gossypium hirsutum TaxID=3635 RepID=A0ABM3AMQ1_GOSHI|nr:LOW QUALITY PROTEIN: glycerophosphodiester phosphodiesterase GDPD2 [Gossypium hirsutum]
MWVFLQLKKYKEGVILGKCDRQRVSEVCLAEFLSYGRQREEEKERKCLLRKTDDGKIVKWDVETNDSLCTLEEAFQKVELSLGFNIELKFEDNVVYRQRHLVHVLQLLLQVHTVLYEMYLMFFVLCLGNQQVFFLTNGGTEIYNDTRRNSLEQAITVCLEGGFQGIVSEIKGVFKNPGAVPKIKDSNLSLLTYGTLK